MISEVLLDMDGVLADWHTAACRACGIERPESLIHKGWALAETLGITEDVLWARVDSCETFWRDLEPYPWVHELVELCQMYGEVTIATSPAWKPSCASQKIEWLREQFGDRFSSFMIGRKKHLMARPNAVLIDDWDKNVKLFRDHGGYAITFPRPWNSMHAQSDNPVAHVKLMLEATRQRAERRAQEI